MTSDTTKFKQQVGRSSADIMAVEVDAYDVHAFMETSFFLPRDVLEHKDWEVSSIQRISGDSFYNRYTEAGDLVVNVHCLENYQLLGRAKWVAISERRHKKFGTLYTVAKIWYGSNSEGVSSK